MLSATDTQHAACRGQAMLVPTNGRGWGGVGGGQGGERRTVCQIQVSHPSPHPHHYSTVSSFQSHAVIDKQQHASQQFTFCLTVVVSFLVDYCWFFYGVGGGGWEVGGLGWGSWSRLSNCRDDTLTQKRKKHSSEFCYIPATALTEKQHPWIKTQVPGYFYQHPAEEQRKREKKKEKKKKREKKKKKKKREKKKKKKKREKKKKKKKREKKKKKKKREKKEKKKKREKKMWCKNRMKARFTHHLCPDCPATIPSRGWTEMTWWSETGRNLKQHRQVPWETPGNFASLSSSSLGLSNDKTKPQSNTSEVPKPVSTPILYSVHIYYCISLDTFWYSFDTQCMYIIVVLLIFF